MSNEENKPSVSFSDLRRSLFKEAASYAKFSDVTYPQFEKWSAQRNIMRLYSVWKTMGFNEGYTPTIIDHSDGVETNKILDHLELTIIDANYSHYDNGLYPSYPIGFYQTTRDALTSLGYDVSSMNVEAIKLALESLKADKNWRVGVGGVIYKGNSNKAVSFLLTNRLRGDKVAFVNIDTIASYLGMPISAIENKVKNRVFNDSEFTIGVYTLTVSVV